MGKISFFKIFNNRSNDVQKSTPNCHSVRTDFERQPNKDSFQKNITNPINDEVEILSVEPPIDDEVEIISAELPNDDEIVAEVLDATEYYKTEIDKRYDKIRCGIYTKKESFSDNISQDDIFNPNNEIRTNNIYVKKMNNSWALRIPNSSGRVYDPKDRFSLNVKADKNLLNELDRFLNTGVYQDRYGKNRKISIGTKAIYKTPINLDNWTTRHDPITIYLEDIASKEVEEALSDISEKYARKHCYGGELMNALENKPWISHERYVSPEDAQNLYFTALKYDNSLANALFRKLHGDRNWNCSTGIFEASKQILEEYINSHCD